MTRMDCYIKFVNLVVDAIGDRARTVDRTDNEELANHEFYDAVDIYLDLLYKDLHDCDRRGDK